jgi:hypothetical protein
LFGKPAERARREAGSHAPGFSRREGIRDEQTASYAARSGKFEEDSEAVVVKNQ